MSPVLVVTSSFPRWPDDSSGRFVAASTQGLRQNGVACQILAPWDVLSRPQSGMRCFRYASGAGAKLAYGAGIMPNLAAHPALIRQAPSLVLRMAQAIRQQNPRHVIAHWLIPAGLSALFAGVKNLIIIVHGSDLALLEYIPGGAFLARFIAAQANVLIFVSEDLRQRFQKLTGLTTGEVLPPTTFAPQAMTREQALTKLDIVRLNGPQLLFVGRVVEGKGLDKLLNALSLLPEAVHLWVAGDGPRLSKMRQLAVHLQLGTRVRFLGQLPSLQVAALYAAADIFVLPSHARSDGHAEGFPTVLIEAMATGLPIVATRVGGVGEWLKNEHNALLCIEKNVSELAKSIKILLLNPQLARVLSRQAVQDVQALLPEEHGQKLLLLLKKHWGDFCVVARTDPRKLAGT